MSDIIPIADPADPRLAAYAGIRERDLVSREGLFVAEGEVVLRVLLMRAQSLAVSLFLAEKRVEPLAQLLAKVPDGIPIYTARQDIMDRIAGFHMHRGILALGRRAPPQTADALLAGLRPQALVLCLIGIANHDNIGGIFRNAAGFGADAVILDTASCDPLYRKAIRVSVGGTLVVPFARLGQEEDALGLLDTHGFDVLALSPHGAETIDAIRPARRTAVLLGAEGPGLPPQILSRARSVRIAMAADFDSLNVATTSGIVLHHLTSRA